MAWKCAFTTARLWAVQHRPHPEILNKHHATNFTCVQKFHSVRERRVQAVLLRQKLGEVFVVVLHFDFWERESVSVQQQKARKPPPIIIKKVFQLCKYGMPRIRCADGVLHVATVAFLRRTGPLLLCLLDQLDSSLQQRWLTGIEGTKAARERRVVLRHKPAEVSSAEGRSSQDWRRLLCAAAAAWMRAASRSDNVNPTIRFFNAGMGVPVWLHGVELL